MRPQLVYVTGFEDWEMVFLDGVQVLQGHSITPIEIFELMASPNLKMVIQSLFMNGLIHFVKISFRIISMGKSIKTC